MSKIENPKHFLDQKNLQNQQIILFIEKGT
jgi:hypothetical protein